MTTIIQPGTDGHPTKRTKIDGLASQKSIPITTVMDDDVQIQDVETSASGSKRKRNKLVPPRPFPTVPTSVSATGPRSAHTEGKNFICVTRRTKLGAYLRRCKEVILEDGHKSLHLSAMGAAIPHLLTLAASLPDVLPFCSDEIHTEILTGTVEVLDEIIPEDEDKDISYETRGKSTVSVVIKIGDGVDEERPKKRQKGEHKVKGKARSKAEQPHQIILSEPEQEDPMDTL